MIEALLLGLGLGLPASAQPGPFQAYLLTQTLRYGWRRTLPASLAPLLSDGPIIVLVLLVLTRVPSSLLTGIQVAGAGLLLYLAWRAWQGFRHYRPIVADDQVANQSMFEAVLVNFFSPNPYLFWTTIAGPILIDAWRSGPLVAVAFLLGFYAALIGGFGLYVLLFGFMGGLDERLGRALALLSAIALAGFGIYQLVTAF